MSRSVTHESQNLNRSRKGGLLQRKEQVLGAYGDLSTVVLGAVAADDLHTHQACIEELNHQDDRKTGVACR